MRRRLCLAFLGLLAGAGLLRFTLTNRLPRAGGRPITFWVEQFANAEDGQQHDAAGAALQKIGTNAIPWLLAELQRSDSQLKQDLMTLTYQCQPIRKWLVGAAEHHQHALLVFELLGDTAKPAIPRLINLLGNTNCATEAGAALVEIGPAALLALTNALTNADAFVRASAVEALGEYGTNGSPAVPALIAHLQDPVSTVREVDIAALGEIAAAPERVVPALIPLLQDAAPAVRSATALTLSKFHAAAQPAVEAMLAALNGSETDVSMIYALQDIGGPGERIVPALLPSLRSADPQTRAAVIGCFGSFPSESDTVVPLLLKAAEESNLQIRLTAFRSLGQLNRNPEVVVPLLIEKLDNPQPVIRQAAAGALGAFGPRAAAAVPALTALLKDDAIIGGGCIISRVSSSAEHALASIQTTPSSAGADSVPAP